MRLGLLRRVFGTVFLLGVGAAHSKADTIAWTQWNSASAVSNGNSAAGSATGTIALGSGVTVTYSGQLNSVQTGYPSWTPAGSFSGGTVGNAPPASGNAIQMVGGNTFTETISFSQAVHDPTFAIWSLGNGGGGGTFLFSDGENFTIQACGPSAEYNGGCIVKNGQTVSGNEGNGVLRFSGDFTSLTFTTPNYEYYYDFTVGAASLATTTAVTPEPSTLSLLGLGLAGMGGVVRRRIKR